MTRKKRLNIKFPLHTLDHEGDSITVEELQKVIKSNPGYKSYYIELSEKSSDCGCYYSCHCNNIECVLYGERPETDEEAKERRKKEREKQKMYKQKIEEHELKELERLKAKYGK